MKKIQVITPAIRTGDSWDIIVQIGEKVFRIHYAISSRDAAISVTVTEGTVLAGATLLFHLVYESKEHLQQAKEIADYASYADYCTKVDYNPTREPAFMQLVDAGTDLHELVEFIENYIPDNYWQLLANAQQNALTSDKVEEEREKHA